MGLTFSWPFLMEKVYHHFARERREVSRKMNEKIMRLP